MDATLLWVGLPRVSLAHIWMYINAIDCLHIIAALFNDEDIRCLLSFVAHFDWLSPHNRSTFQRCLHTYVNLSSGCNTFMSRLAQSQPGTHLNVHKCETKTFVVCCRLLHTSIDCLHTIAALFNDVCIPM